MRVRELYRAVVDALTPLYGEREARAVAGVVCEHFEGVDSVGMIAHPERECRTADEELAAVVARLAKGEPVRHITGECHFLERRFEVSADTLIPRPETEELVYMIASRWRGRECRHAIDFATGSGVIAITLALDVAERVTAVDISGAALEVARRNASNLGCDNITFRECDLLRLESVEGADLVVSNPPYVCESEKSLMSSSVLDYEPHVALFVDDSDPLIFYRKIAQLAWGALGKGGELYFEINEAFGSETAELCRQCGFAEAEVVQDLFGKERFVVARKG